MSKVERFEDLVAWQKAKQLAKDVYDITRADAFSRDFGLSRQIQRAAVSVMSNIAEGFERHKPGEFHQFLSIAKGSCAEVRSQLYIAHEIGYMDQAKFQKLLAQAEEVTRILAGLRHAVETQKLAAKH